MYVRVHGHLKGFQGKTQLVIFSIRFVKFMLLFLFYFNKCSIFVWSLLVYGQIFLTFYCNYVAALPFFFLKDILTFFYSRVGQDYDLRMSSLKVLFTWNIHTLNFSPVRQGKANSWSCANHLPLVSIDGKDDLFVKLSVFSWWGTTFPFFL